MIFANATLVLAEDHIHTPMQLILHAPMTTRQSQHLFGVPAGQAGYVVVTLTAGLAANLADPLNTHHASQAGPIDSRSDAIDVPTVPAAARLDPAMPGVNVFGKVVGNALALVAQPLIEQQLEVLVQRRLVVFDLQEIVAAAVAYGVKGRSK